MRIPHELQRSIPRDVTLTGPGRFLTALAWGLAAAAIGVSAWLFSQALRAHEAETTAVAASAQIVRLGATRDEHPRWVAHYVYTVGGTVHEGRATLERQDRRRREIGETIAVRYVPHRPATSWVEGRQPDRIPMFVPPLVFVAFGFAAAALTWTIRGQRAMLSNGRPAIGTVKDTKKVSGQHGSSHYRTTVEYQTFGGGKVSRAFDFSKSPTMGSEVVVLYDPETPRRAVRYPLSLVKPAEG